MSDKHFGQKDVWFAVYQQGVWMGSIVAKMWQSGVFTNSLENTGFG